MGKGVKKYKSEVGNGQNFSWNEPTGGKGSSTCNIEQYLMHHLFVLDPDFDRHFSPSKIILLMWQ